MSFIQQVERGFGYSAVAMGMVRLFIFINFIILARLLSTEDLGMYSTAFATISLFVILSTFGVHTTVARTIALYRIQDPVAVGGFLSNALSFAACSSVIFAFVMALLAGPASEQFILVAGFAELIEIVAWSIPFLTLWMVANAGLQGMEDFRGYSQTLISSALLLVPITYLFTRMAGLRGALWASVVTNALVLLVATVLLIRCLRRNSLHLEYQITRRFFEELVSFSLPLVLGSILIFAAWWLANLYLARVQDFTQVGLFAVAFGIFQSLQFLPNALGIPTLPVLAGRFAEIDTPNFNRLLDSALRHVWVLSLPIVAAICILAEPLAGYLFGSRFAAAANPIQWMAMAGLISAVMSMVGVALISSGRIWTWLGFTSLWFVLFAGFSAALVPSGGATGLAQATLLSVILSSAAIWHHSASKLQFSVSFSGRIVALTVLALLGSWLLAPATSKFDRVETVLMALACLTVGIFGAASLVLIPEERGRLLDQLTRSVRATRNM